MRDVTEIVCVIDKSGSMGPRQSDAIGGFNLFLKNQKELPGEANLTVVLFDTTYELWPVKPVKEAVFLDTANYRPAGCTALLDALGRAIQETGKRLEAITEADRPDKVIVVILTDGEENASVEFKIDQIASMIRHQTDKYNWKFLYLGASLDAFGTACNMGITAPAQSCSFDAQHQIHAAYRGIDLAVSSYRKSGLIDTDWKNEIT